MLEKWWAEVFGLILTCLLVRVARSRAAISPAAVTISALDFRRSVIVMAGVFRGVIFEVKIKPAIRLPQASRIRGLITAGSFSLMGERGRKRGWPIETIKTTRRL